MSAPLPKTTGREPCQDDPEMFFTLANSRSRAVQDAKELCSWCPIKDACLAYALTCDVRGIWGGSTAEERAALRKRARKVAAS